MKSKSTLRNFLALAGSSLLAISYSHAATLYWDGNVSSANSTSNNSSSTSTNWLSGGNWDNGTTSASRASWTSGDTAIFGGTTSGPQTVTLGSQATVGDGTIIGGAGSSYKISLTGTGFNQLGAPSGTITINAGSTLSADAASNNAHNLLAITLNGGTLTSANGPTGPANDVGNNGNWIVRGVTVGGSSLSTISSATLVIASGSFNVADAVAGSGTDLLVSSKILSGALTKDGAGTMELTGTNTYAGATAVNLGILRAGAAAGGQAFGNGSAVTLANVASTSLDLNGFSQTIGSLAGGGTTGGNVTLGANATLTAGGNNTSTSYAGVISGTGTSGLTKTGNGILTLTNANSYSGTTAIDGGKLLVSGSSGSLGTGAIQVGSTGTLEFADSTGARNIANNISGSGAIIKNGTGTNRYNFSGDNSGFTGTYTQTGAQTGFTSATAGSAGASWILNGTFFTTNISTATVKLGALSGSASHWNDSTSGTTTLEVGGKGTDTIFSGNIGSGTSGAITALTKTGAGTLTLTGTNNYAGATSVNAGKLSLGHATNTLSSSTAVTVDGATAELSIAGNSDTVGAVSLKNGGSITGTVGTLTGASYAVESGSVSAKLGGAGVTLTKTTGGTVTLTGVNTYTGATAVNAGTLIVGVAGVGSTAAGSAVSVGASGTLGGSGTINGTLAVSGTLAPGNSGIGTLTAGATTWNSGSVWNFNLSSINNTSDKLAINGAFTKPGAGTYQFNFMSSTPVAWGTTYDLLTFTSTNFTQSDFSFTGLLGTYNNGTFAITGGNTLQFTAIPEPTSALAGLLLGAGLLRRRRQVYDGQGRRRSA